MSEEYECILDECKNKRSIYRAFCSKDCQEAFFKKYPEVMARELLL